MSRSVLSFLILCSTLWTNPAMADVWTFRQGLGTSFVEDRDTKVDSDLIVLSLLPSYRSRTWDVALDLNLRWDASNGEFFKDEWGKRGDWLRPIERLLHTSNQETLTFGLQRLTGLTLGSGQIVRGLIGNSEVYYGLPGFYLNADLGKTRIQAAVDRVYEPSVAGAAIFWEASRRLSLSLEGAVDPSAPVSFLGRFVDGRPEPDGEKEITGLGGEIVYRVFDGDLIKLAVDVQGGSLPEGARGYGGGIRLDFDFSAFYLSRLTFNVDSIACKNGYIPAYFDELYPLERWNFGGKTLVEANPLGGTVSDRDMWVTSIRYNLGDFFLVAAGYDRSDDGSLERAQFSVKILEEGGKGIELYLWSRTNSEGESLFDDDQNLFGRVTALYNFTPHLLVRAGFDHSWSLDEDRGGVVPRSDFILNLLYTVSM